MAQKKSTLGPRLLLWLVIFGTGFAAGFFVRDTRKHEVVTETAEEALERTRRAGEALKEGAQEAAGAVAGENPGSNP